MFTAPQRSHSLRRKPIDPPVRSSSLSTTTTLVPITTPPLPPLPPLSSSSSSTTSTTTSSIITTPHDEALSLLEWKRCSILRSIDWSNILVPTELWSSNPFPSMTTAKDECQETADRLWLGDTSMIPPAQSMASFLGCDNTFAQCTLKLYIAKFDFAYLKLDDALRKLCQKLYFKAEAQEIDRILEVFAHRYWTCNRHELFGSPDIVYAIVYSLMLLNTDLHIATGHQRMSRSAFCKNTMNTLLDHTQSVDVARFGGLDQWSLEMELRLKELYGSVKHQGFTRPTAETAPLEETSLLQRMGSLQLNKQQQVDEAIDVQDEEVILEGYFNCTTIRTTSSSVKGRRKAASVRECQLKLYPGYLHILLSQATTTSSTTPGSNGGSLSPSVKLSAPIPRSRSATYFDRPRTSEDNATRDLPRKMTRRVALAHAFAVLHSPSPSFSRHAFKLELPDGKSYVYSCKTEEDAEKWVSQCNYWAACTTKVLQVGQGVTSAIFGWESHVLKGRIDLDRMPVQEWKPPLVVGTVPAPCNVEDEVEQLKLVKSRLEGLLEDREKHTAVWRQMRLIAEKSSKWNRIEANWAVKKTYIDTEIQKHTAYASALELHAKQQQRQQKQEDVRRDRQQRRRQQQQQQQQKQKQKHPETTPSLDNGPAWAAVTMDLLKEINEELQLSGNSPLLSG